MHDDGALLIFYPENSQIRREIESYLKNNDLKVKDEWTIINSMHLTHPTNPSKYVSKSPELLGYIVFFWLMFLLNYP